MYNYWGGENILSPPPPLFILGGGGAAPPRPPLSTPLSLRNVIEENKICNRREWGTIYYLW